MRKRVVLFFILLTISSSLCAKTKEKTKETTRKKTDLSDCGIKYHIVPKANDKETILRCAKQARECANAHLDRARELLDKLKTADWRIRDRLSVLVTSYISSAFIPDPKAKLLGVGLALLGDLIVNDGFNTVETIYQLSLQLVYAADSLEMFNYYNRLSKNAKMVKHVENKSWEYTNRALDFLTEADMLTAFIEFSTTMQCVSAHITKIRDRIMSDMVDEGNILINYDGVIEICLENFDEIVEDIHLKNRGITEMIRKRLEQAAKLINLAY